MYMAITQKPLEDDHDLHAALYHVISASIANHSKLLLHIMDIAVEHIHKAASTSPDWLRKLPNVLVINHPGQNYGIVLRDIDHWVLLHLDTLLAPKTYLLPEEVGKLEWSDTPEKVHIAKARLDLYDSLVDVGHEAESGSKPDSGLLRVFLWSKDHGDCIRAFKWYLNLVPNSQLGTPGGANGTSTFIPEVMGYEWVEHFTHVFCNGENWERVRLWEFLISGLVLKWTMLPASWCCDFASVLLFSIVQPLGKHGRPVYQYLAEALDDRPLDAWKAFLPFLATLLTLVKSSLTWVTLTLLENWLARLPHWLENQDAHMKMIHILAIRKPQLTLEFFVAELPMAITATSP